MSVRVASIQLDIRLGDSANRERCVTRVREALTRGARLVVLPECANTGYIFRDRDEADALAETIPGPTSQALQPLCRSAEAYVVVGLLEKTATGRLYNAAALVGPQGVLSVYRKAHLPRLGVDLFVQPGDLPFSVSWTDVGALGMLICYDLRFPEPARVLALRGCEVLALPANWPEGAVSPLLYTRTRAHENRVYLIAANRIGEERGVRFMGCSQIVDPAGNVLAEAQTGEEILIADIDPAAAHEKYFVDPRYGFVLDVVGDRRADLYGELTKRSGRRRSK